MRNPGPENANSFRQNGAVAGITTLRWTSGSETCPAGLRQPVPVAGTWILSCWFRGFCGCSGGRSILASGLKSHGDSGEGIEIVCRARDAKIAAAVELHIFRHQEFKAEIHRPDPAGMAFRADVAEEFDIAAQLPGDGVAKRGHVDEIRVIITVAAVLKEARAGFQTQIEAARQLDGQRQKKAAFDRMIAQPVRARRKFGVRKKSASIPPRLFLSPSPLRDLHSRSSRPYTCNQYERGFGRIILENLRYYS